MQIIKHTLIFQTKVGDPVIEWLELTTRSLQK